MTPMDPWQWTVGIVIPACNEEKTIERCLSSVLASRDLCNRCDSVWVVVVADGCVDETASIARRAVAARGEVIECAVHSPGSARRIGVHAVLERFGTIDPTRLWIANTDADTHVPTDWLSTHLAHADNDAGAVAGIVELDPEGLRPEVSQLYRRTYALAADGTHQHVHGANLGVRADAYLDVGGWSDLKVSEDHCLWGRLMRNGWRLRSPAASVVTTSGRLVGRAQGGFADTLKKEVQFRA